MTTTRIRQTVRHELVRRRLEVLRTERLTSTLLRVTLGGAELEGFTALGPEDHVKLFFETPAGEAVRRDYTPRAFRQEAGELDVDFVVHGGTGPASAWALSAKSGSTLDIGGPRGSRLAPDGYDRILLIADESSVPALCRWIEAASPSTPVTAFVQSDASDIGDYPFPDGAAVTIIPTGADPALAAVASFAPDADSFVWAAGEATALIPVRRHLRRELQLARDDVKVDGYWRLGLAGLDHHAPLDPENPED